jgi:uncharacterized small protein (DUF1192 family)
MTVQELKDKIAMVEADIASLSSQGQGERRLEVLHEYIDYLKDELRMAQQENESK